MAIEVPVKPIERQRNRGELFAPRRNDKRDTGGKPRRNARAIDDDEAEPQASPVQWVRQL